MSHTQSIAIERSFLPRMGVEFLPLESIEMHAVGALPMYAVEEIFPEEIAMVAVSEPLELADYIFPNGERINVVDFFTREDAMALMARKARQ